MRASLVKMVIAGAVVAGVAAVAMAPPPEQRLASYATSMAGRTRGQRLNAVRAAKAIDGTVIQPGATFSFNRTVGSWTPDRGYVLAPVSYGGELVVDWGGGVCQTSSTLYNAALLAGLEIVERHRHNWAPSYVPPGRDAAVAQYEIDLQIRNPYPWPVRIRAVIGRDILGFDIYGRARGPMAKVWAKVIDVERPARVIRCSEWVRSGKRRIVPGRAGVSVVVYRKFLKGPRQGSTELVSRDCYPPVNALVLVGAAGHGSRTLGR